MELTKSERIAELVKRYPDLDDSEAALVIGCSLTLVRMVRERRGKPKQCLDCGTTISAHAKRCISCAPIYTRMRKNEASRIWRNQQRTEKQEDCAGRNQAQ